MFDHEQTVKVKLKKLARAIAGAAAAETPPVRILDGDSVHYLRPANVLRISSDITGMWSFNPTAQIETTDGQQILFRVLTADAVAEKLGFASTDAG